MSQALRKLTSVISKTNTVVVFINQLREKVGVVYGNPETTTGGKALKFYATIRIDIRKSEAIKEGKEVVGNKTKVKIVKNKVAPPFRTCVVEMMYGEGISRTGEILDFAVEMDLIQKSGSFYSYNNERIGQGRDNAKRYLLDKPDVFDALDRQIREKMLQDPTVVSETMVREETIADLTAEDERDDEEFELDDEPAVPSADNASDDITLEDLEEAVS